MIRIRLGAEDREALGAPEVLDIDPRLLRLKEIRAIQREAGFTVEQLAAALKNKELDAIAAMVWIGLRRAGVEVTFEDLDFSFADLDMEVDKNPNRPAPDGASTPS